MNANMPTMASAAHTHSTYSADALFANALALGAPVGGIAGAAKALGNPIAQFQQEKKPMTTRRVVQVFVADPNDNIPLDDCLLFKGDEKLTDATDQELFFELDIKDLLEKHNEKRIKVIDKKVKDRTEYLEPAKVRDLKMVVVTVANL
ncbi:hypothetical protein [Bradyrhizobium sp. 62]|uniref:hypothetical protein n=1 Tax=Bradyrhizobium sp. 62 TaxID=1043588 RepID=UPI001FFBA28B|nr:hypothetical protein [Bradyrhizobium sp. 62]MCK1363513.1 hypothetical protein [Bradyrhizobium sp. 62]